MEFGTFLGNETLKDRLSAALEHGQLSHCYLIAGPAGSGKRTLTKLLCAAMQCTSKKKPCLHCAQCNKVLADVHPDVCMVDDPEKKIVPVKIVRDACADMYIRPNEGAKKIYIFPRAQDLNPQGQNALLKCMEEPPAYGVFLLITDNPDRLLPTIRSRCAQLQLAPLPEQTLLAALREQFPQQALTSLQSAVIRSGGYLGQAIALVDAQLLPQSIEFVRAYCAHTDAALLQVLVPMERLKREQLHPILLQWQSLLTSALASRSGMPPIQPECTQIAGARSAASILSGIEAIQEALSLTDANVGVGHICGALSILLR